MQQEIEERLETIYRDREHGAAFLAREALMTMKVAALKTEADNPRSFLWEMAKLGSRLVSLRPSMSAPIANGVVRVFDVLLERAGRGGVAALKGVVCEAVDDLLKVAERNASDAAMHASRAIPQGATVMTHSYSETCLEALVACAEKGVKVFATESRPLYEGRKTAAALREAGVEVTLITDAQTGHFVSDVQMVLVGADTVLADGSVVNKVGTYLIALAAKEAGVPFVVVSDSWKFRIEAGVPEMEEKGSEEVIDGASGIAARNVYFDLTPARLIGSLITEEGPIRPEEVGLRSGRWAAVLRAMREHAK